MSIFRRKPPSATDIMAKQIQKEQKAELKRHLAEEKRRKRVEALKYQAEVNKAQTKAIIARNKKIKAQKRGGIGFLKIKKKRQSKTLSRTSRIRLI